MAKIRGLKPELWTDESFVELSPFARLLWMGLWNYACDNGHLQDKSKQIKMRILPTDDVNCAELLREIEDQGLIVRVSGWITIPNLSHHQKPHKRWWTTCDMPGCVLPEGASHAPANRGTTVAPPKGNGVATADGDGDGDCEGDGDGDAKAATATTRKRAHHLRDDFQPNDTNRRIATERGLDVAALLPQFMDHHRAKGSTMKDWHLAFNTWIRNERPSAPTRPPRNLQAATEIELPPDGLDAEQYAAWEREQRARRGA